jgi:hypothetical protein
MARAVGGMQYQQRVHEMSREEEKEKEEGRELET